MTSSLDSIKIIIALELLLVNSLHLYRSLLGQCSSLHFLLALIHASMYDKVADHLCFLQYPHLYSLMDFHLKELLEAHLCSKTCLVPDKADPFAQQAIFVAHFSMLLSHLARLACLQ